MEHKMFSTLSPLRLFFRCALPSMAGMAVSSLYMVADGIFVGKFIGSHALAAINLVMPVIMISFALSDMIAVGSSVQISIRLGQGKEREACTVFSFSSLFIVAISCLVGLAGFFGGAQAVRLMGAGDDVLNLAVEYMRVYAVFAPFIMIFFALDNYLRVCGRTIYSMGMNIFIALSNLFFDWLFIVHFRMGVSSAALASCISLTLGTGIGLFPFFGKKLVLRFVSPRIPWHILRNIIGNCSSEFFSNISASVSMVIMNAVLLRLSGAMAVATFSIVMYIDSFVSSMLFGMVDALQPAISYNFGAAKYTRMFRLEKILMTAGAVISISAMAFMLTGGHLIIPFFMEGDQPELTAMASRAMHLFSFSYLFNWIGTAAGSFFTAMNKPAVSLAVSFGQTMAFPLVSLAVLPAFLGIDGVWLTSLSAEIMTAALALSFMMSFRKIYGKNTQAPS